VVVVALTGEAVFGAGRVERVIIGSGLLIAVVAGLAGRGFESVATKSVLFALSSVGWVTATAILAFQQAHRGELTVAAGFLILTIAETLLWVSGRPGDPAYEVGFAGGAMFYVPGLLMIGVPAVFPWIIRALAILSAGAWTLGTARFLTGSGFSDTDPLAIAGYSLISAFFAGVAWVSFFSRAAAVGSRRDEHLGAASAPSHD
jgi:hypothetical protein